MTDETEENQEATTPSVPPLPNPADSGYPSGLALELALRVASPTKVLDTYNIDAAEWKRIRAIPAFQQEYRELVEKSKEKGFSYQMKAAAQAEGLLKTSWDMIQDKDTPASVRADLIKFTAKMGGFDEKKGGLFGGDDAPGDGGITITINLGEDGDKDVKTISGPATIENNKEDGE